MVRKALPGKTLRAWMIAGMAVVLSATCAETPTSGCDPCSTSAVVYGTVVDSAGIAQARLPLEIRTYLVDCGQRIRGGSTFATDSLGGFRRRVRSLDSPHRAGCVRVIANPVGRPEWPVDTLDFASALDFRFEEDESRLDSLRLDVTLSR